MLVETEFLSQIEEITSDFLNEIKTALIAYLTTNNRNATGRSAASIQESNVTDKGGQLVGSGSITWVFTGRGPGGFPPLSNIIDWLNARGLPRGMAWAVAKKISQEGTRLYQQGGPTDNGLTQTLTPERINAFAKNISVLIATDITSDIKGIFA